MLYSNTSLMKPLSQTLSLGSAAWRFGLQIFWKLKFKNYIQMQIHIHVWEKQSLPYPHHTCCFIRWPDCICHKHLSNQSFGGGQNLKEAPSVATLFPRLHPPRRHSLLSPLTGFWTLIWSLSVQEWHIAFNHVWTYLKLPLTT